MSQFRPILSDSGAILYWNNPTCPAGSGATDTSAAPPAGHGDPVNGDVDKGKDKKGKGKKGKGGYGGNEGMGGHGHGHGHDAGEGGGAHR